MKIQKVYANNSNVCQYFQWYHILDTFFGLEVGQTISSKRATSRRGSDIKLFCINIQGSEPLLWEHFPNLGLNWVGLGWIWA